MPDDFEIRGAEKFLRLSKALKAAGEKDMRRELNKSLRDAVKPLIPKTRAAARSMLPKRGGLAESVAKAPQRVQVRTGQRTAGVRLVVARNGSAARGANKGVVRHPVFDTGVYVDQEVPAGWFDKTLEKEAPTVARKAITEALDDMADRIVREVR